MDRLNAVCNLQGFPFPNCPKNCRGFFFADKGHGCGNKSIHTTCESFKRLTLNFADDAKIGAVQQQTIHPSAALYAASPKAFRQKTAYDEEIRIEDFSEHAAISRLAISLR